MIAVLRTFVFSIHNDVRRIEIFKEEKGGKVKPKKVRIAPTKSNNSILHELSKAENIKK